MDGAIQRVYTRKNWSSMVLCNCSHPNNVVPLTSEIVSAQTGTFLHLLPGSTMTRSGNCPSPETSSSVTTRLTRLIWPHAPGPSTIPPTVAVCVWVVLCRPGTHASSGASSGSSPAEPNSCLSDRGTLPTLDIVCGLKIQRLLGSARFGASLCPWGVLSRASGDFCAARRSALGLRFMVLLIHVLFVGAVFILSPVSPFPFYSLRVAACSRATVGMLLGGEDMHRFPVRSPRMDRDDLIRSPAARQIVSNYFGYPEHTPPLLAPLLRLFRFVSTSRPITLPRHRWTEQHVRADVGRAHPVPAEAHVRLRHLRVRRDGEGHPEQGQPALRVRRALVKPYKEKGKVPGRFRKLQHAHHGGAEFAGCASPTGLLDSRDPYALLLLSSAQVFS
ncbi:Zinc finger CCCH domain-containing protein 46 [Zea mays]|uniref:Zinc finger CCCH domain-containing protein 46 n=1 Tax=Zea mays TaxID=4577 RepID=A0A1D6Q6F8_MAIZE|nr:Zinc finger CCCH domain-containing protein 46 [Zea mays]